MLSINKHIETIAQHFNDYPNTALTPHLDFFTIKTTIEATDKHGQVERTIIVTAENTDRQFQVRMEEVAIPPNFKFNKDNMFFHADKAGNVEWACNYIHSLLNSRVKPELIPPAKYVEKWEDINNRWLINSEFSCGLYLDSGEFGDDWRFNLRHVSDQLICEHLDPEITFGQTCVSLARAAEDAFNRGVVEGETRAIERTCYNVTAGAIDSGPRDLWRYPNELGNLIKNKALRPKKNVI